MNESLAKRLAHDNKGAVMMTGLFMSFFLVGSLWFVMGVGDAAIFRSLEAKNPGAGGLFSIFVSDLCKGCGECVQVCGDHDALRMTRETEDLNAELTTAQFFSRLLPDTPQ
jgi:ferredoxin